MAAQITHLADHNGASIRIGASDRIARRHINHWTHSVKNQAAPAEILR